MQLAFSDKVVLVTGAAQGIGQAIASKFLASGARVIVADIDAANLQAFCKKSGAHGCALDLGDREAVRDAVQAIIRDHGQLDIIVHAAGGTRGQEGRPIAEIEEDDWKQIFEANVDGAFWLAQACAPFMQASGSGRIVAIASGAGLRPSLTGIQAYTAAKHALVGLVKQLSWELGPSGITVNAVAPGFVLSNPTTRRQWDKLGEAGQANLLNSIHTRRLGSTDDIAQAVLFLASDEAAWISGQILSVDGGRS